MFNFNSKKVLRLCKIKELNFTLMGCISVYGVDSWNIWKTPSMLQKNITFFQLFWDVLLQSKSKLANIFHEIVKCLFQNLICSLCSIGNKIWVYEIFKLLQSFLFTFYTASQCLGTWGCDLKLYDIASFFKKKKILCKKMRSMVLNKNIENGMLILNLFSLFFIRYLN